MFEGMGYIHPRMQRATPPAAACLAAPAACGNLAARGIGAGLLLPRIADGVPSEIKPRKLASANARIAQFLIDAKVVTERDIPAQWSDELDVCAKALDAWLKRETGELRCIAPNFVLRPVTEDAGASWGAPSANTDYREVEIVWFQYQERQWAVGGGLERLESIVPNLGATVLDILDDQSRFVYPLFAPRTAQDIASMLYWYGEADEALAVEEACGDDAEAQAAMREEMITAKDMAEAFPAWGLAWKPNKLGHAELAQVAQACPDAYGRDLAAIVLELARMCIKDEFRSEAEGEFIGFGAVLSWREDDITVRIYDDLINMAHEAEFCDLMGQVCFTLTEPAAMRAWQRKMRQRFKAMRLIDALIWRLSQAN